MRMRFKSVLVIIGVILILVVSLGIGYIFYDKVIDQSDIVVDGDITINYKNGKSFKYKGDKTIEFSVTNNGNEQKYYYIELTDVDASNVMYTLKSDTIAVSNNLKSDIISNQIVIDSGVTHKYVMNFINSNNEKYAATIEIGSKVNEDNTFVDVILENNSISNATLTSFYSEATLDEGLLSGQDDFGIAYYFRGATKSNNVHFANLDWKIVKINGDGTVKLVLDGIINDLSAYYADGKDYEYLSSSIKTKLDTWFKNNLSLYSDYIAYYKYCNDTIMESNEKDFIAYTRVVTNNIPTYVCLGTTVNAQIGLLTADEVVMAGAGSRENKDYYLYNSKIETPYFTMTSGEYGNKIYYPFIVKTDGGLSSNVAGTLLRGVRPVINIVRGAKVTGDGSSENPYEIVID